MLQIPKLPILLHKYHLTLKLISLYLRFDGNSVWDFALWFSGVNGWNFIKIFENLFAYWKIFNMFYNLINKNVANKRWKIEISKFPKNNFEIYIFELQFDFSLNVFRVYVAKFVLDP